MPSTCESFSADYFNNIAAVAVVVIFAKSITYRSKSKAAEVRQGKAILSPLVPHFAAQVCAAGAVVAALFATAQCFGPSWFQAVAAVLLSAAGVILAIDVVRGDVGHLKS